MPLEKESQKAVKAVADAAAAKADDEQVEDKDIGKSSGGNMVSAEVVALARKLPEKDDVQKAVKAGMLAKTPAEEVSEKVKVVKASPDAEETPSGAALIAVEGISDDTKQAAAYRAAKAALRRGVVEV